MATEAEKIAPPNKGKGGMITLVLVAVLAMGAGYAAPLLMGGHDGHKTHKKETESHKPVLLPFGDGIPFNLGEERLNRFVKAKIILVIDGNHEKAITELIAKQKPHLKSWLISYLADLSVEDIRRAAGVNRVRREIRDQFNALLYPDGSELILDVLFDEFLVT